MTSETYTETQIQKAFEALRDYPDSDPANLIPDPKLRELAQAKMNESKKPAEEKITEAPEPPTEGTETGAPPAEQGEPKVADTATEDQAAGGPKVDGESQDK